jgi:hypothetical protein
MDEREQDLLADSLQKVEDELSGGFVGPFLVIMEIEDPQHPDDVFYRTVRRGSPASQLGLESYLSNVVHERIFGGE